MLSHSDGRRGAAVVLGDVLAGGSLSQVRQGVRGRGRGCRRGIQGGPRRG